MGRIWGTTLLLRRRKDWRVETGKHDICQVSLGHVVWPAALTGVFCFAGIDGCAVVDCSCTCHAVPGEVRMRARGTEGRIR